MKVLLLGGTGVISRQIVLNLLNKGHEVTIYNRGSRDLGFSGEVKIILGDKFKRDEFEAEMRKLWFDAVIDMICFNEEDARSDIRALNDNVGQLVVCSSVAGYKRPYKAVPIREDREELIDDPAYQYGFHKAEMERYLYKAMDENDLPITIIRPSLTFGEGSANVGVLRQNYGIIDRIKKGKPLVMFGDGTTPWAFTFSPDLAKAFTGVIGNKKAYNRAFHATSDEAHIWDDLYLEIGRIIGIEPIIKHIPTDLLMEADKELFGHIYYEKSYSGIFDNTRIKSVIPGFEASISLNQGLTSLIQWYEKEANTIDLNKDKYEDALIEKYDKWAAEIRTLKL